MSYSDKEMRAFSQVAYADFTKAYDYLSAKTGRTSFSISELEAVSKAIDSNADFKMLDCLTPEQKETWQISAVHDTSSDNGFYGCIIETAPGEATLAFRGSNAASDPNSLIHDWGGADFGLLGNLQTRQQAEVERFLGKYKDQINGYQSINLTGHSLGGNLAEYATLVSHRYGFDSKVDRCVSLDGPGFSHYFIETHMSDYLRMKDKMTHYRWSPVGACLFEFPGMNIIDAATTNDDDANALTIHDTKYLDFDGDGKIIKGKRQTEGMIVQSLSQFLDCAWFSPFIGFGLNFISFIWGTVDDVAEFFRSVADGAMSIYQQLKKALKDFFHSASDYFRVDTNQLEGDVQGVRKQLDSIRKSLDEMYYALSEVNGMWTGKANKAFVEKFSHEREIINEFLKEIDGYAERLERDSRSYISCEQKVCGQVASVRI